MLSLKLNHVSKTGPWPCVILEQNPENIRRELDNNIIAEWCHLQVFTYPTAYHIHTVYPKDEAHVLHFVLFGMVT